MQVPLFELYQSSEDAESKPKLVELASFGNTAPFEYEDGLGENGVTDGAYRTQAMEVS